MLSLSDHNAHRGYTGMCTSALQCIAYLKMQVTKPVNAATILLSTYETQPQHEPEANASSTKRKVKKYRKVQRLEERNVKETRRRELV